MTRRRWMLAGLMAITGCAAVGEPMMGNLEHTVSDYYMGDNVCVVIEEMSRTPAKVRGGCVYLDWHQMHQISQNYGPEAVEGVIAHEVRHLMQRDQGDQGRSVTREVDADVWAVCQMTRRGVDARPFIDMMRTWPESDVHPHGKDRASLAEAAMVACTK